MPTAASFRALGWDIKKWEQYHLPQGSTNDCGPTNIAMVLNALIGQPGTFSKDMIGAEMYQTGGRIPQSWSKIGGATFPWSMANEFNRVAVRENIPWRARLQNNGTKKDLMGYLQQGQPVTVLKIWDNGRGAHYETVIGYDHALDKIITLDPSRDPTDEKMVQEEILNEQPWDSFNADWSRQAWWSRLVGIQNEMIIYVPLEPTPPTPIATPAPEPDTSVPLSSTPEPNR